SQQHCKSSAGGHEFREVHRVSLEFPVRRRLRPPVYLDALQGLKSGNNMTEEPFKTFIRRLLPKHCSPPPAWPFATEWRPFPSGVPPASASCARTPASGPA